MRVARACTSTIITSKCIFFRPPVERLTIVENCVVTVPLCECLPFMADANLSLLSSVADSLGRNHRTSLSSVCFSGSKQTKRLHPNKKFERLTVIQTTNTPARQPDFIYNYYYYCRSKDIRTFSSEQRRTSTIRFLITRPECEQPFSRKRLRQSHHFENPLCHMNVVHTICSTESSWPDYK